MKFTLNIFAFLLPLLSFGQGYNLSCFEKNFNEDVILTSLKELTDGDYSPFTCQFGFEFPYSDTIFTSITNIGEATYLFDENDEDFTVELLHFLYDIDYLGDKGNSDILYGYLSDDTRDVLVFEYRKMRLTNDSSIEDFDSYLSFQHWFYSDGTIEIHFGDQNLQNSPSYIEGEGFYLNTGEQSILLGPQVRLRNYFTGQEIEGIGGDYEMCLPSSKVESNILNTIPDKGSVIQFRPITLSVESSFFANSITVFPNPASEIVEIKNYFSEKIVYEIIDLYGNQKLVGELNQNLKIDISGLAPGTYFIKTANRFNKIIKL